MKRDLKKKNSHHIAFEGESDKKYQICVTFKILMSYIKSFHVSQLMNRYHVVRI